MRYDQKILIVRFSSIGDIVQSTSPLRTIRNAFPDSQITFLTLCDYAPILELHPDINCLLTINRKQTLKEIWDMRDYLRDQNYQLIFDLHNSIRSKILTYKNPVTIARLKKPRLKRFALFYLHINLFSNRFSVLRMYHEHLGSIWKGEDVIPPTLLKVSEFEKKEAWKILNSRGVHGEFIVAIPGAAWEQKQWSAKNYITTINKINLPTVLIGSKKDTICKEIASGVDNSVNFAGETDLRLALSIIANAENIIGSDTGLVHAAEALGKKVIMILGPTSRQTGAGIRLKDSKVIQKDIWCRPCSQNGKFPCYRKTQKCMINIRPRQVIEAFYSPKLI